MTTNRVEVARSNNDIPGMFVVITTEAEGVTHTSDSLNEAAARTYLRHLGWAPSDIDELIERAKASAPISSAPGKAL